MIMTPLKIFHLIDTTNEEECEVVNISEQHGVITLIFDVQPGIKTATTASE